MKPGAGYFYLHAANQWPAKMFQLSGIETATDGSLVVKQNGGVYGSSGLLLIGPITKQPLQAEWYRLRALADPLPPGTHLQLFTSTNDAAQPPFPGPDWTVQPRDQLDVLIRRPDATQLWVGCVFRSDGQSTPALRQIRVDYGRDTYLEFLPAIYAQDDSARDFMERFLSLAASVAGGLEQTITDLTRLFDPDAAPADGAPSWLDWLSGWLAWMVSRNWTEQQARDYLARAFALYRRRGTVAGLRRYIKIYAGVESHIEEPLLRASAWTLGESSSLGWTTALADPEQVAVLNTTASLDRSKLDVSGDCCPSLFGEVAHRFCVRVYCGELTRPEALEDIRAVLDREKPAHTIYHLSVIEPSMRVGAQSRIGIDAIVAGGPPQARFGIPLGAGVLAAKAEECKGETHVTSDVEC